MPTNKYEPVEAKPVKSFFVEMLTRDIDLVDAILDLLDNCVDGILRLRSRLKTPFFYLILLSNKWIMAI